MARMYHDTDANLALIQAKKVGIIGYGSQGHAHALNLKESGVDVRVGLPVTSKSVAKAQAAGLVVGTIPEVAAWADVLMLLVPDTRQAEVYERDIKPALTAGKMLMFAHGFNIRFNCIVPPANVDVTMVAPKGAPRDELERMALQSDKITKLLDGAAPRKVIVVPDRLVNIVA